MTTKAFCNSCFSLSTSNKHACLNSRQSLSKVFFQASNFWICKHEFHMILFYWRAMTFLKVLFFSLRLMLGNNYIIPKHGFALSSHFSGFFEIKKEVRNLTEERIFSKTTKGKKKIRQGVHFRKEVQQTLSWSLNSELNYAQV